MRSVKWLTLAITLLFSASYSYADEIEDLVLQQISTKTFMEDLYIEEYQGDYGRLEHANLRL